MGQGQSTNHVDQYFGKLVVPPFHEARKYDVPIYSKAAYLQYSLEKYQEALDVLGKGELELEDKVLKCFARVHGERPEKGYMIFIGMHGGGGCPKDVNDAQWENHKWLYKEDMPDGCIWIAPRAPEDAWNMWHLPYIDLMFEKLFEYLIIANIADPNKLYITGYSAGGDGTYRLGTRMADWLAGAAMCAGHPGDTTLKNCRNIGFCLHVGGSDHAYDRASIARKLTDQISEFKNQDGSDGYHHFCQVYDGKGHWMDGQEGAVFPWLAQRTRNPYPHRIVWEQDCDVMKRRFYWIGVPLEAAKRGKYLEAKRNGNVIDIYTVDYEEVIIYLNDGMVDLFSPVTVNVNGVFHFSDNVPRSLYLPHDSLKERGDPYAGHCATLTVRVNEVATTSPNGPGINIGVGHKGLGFGLSLF